MTKAVEPNEPILTESEIRERMDALKAERARLKAALTTPSPAGGDAGLVKQLRSFAEWARVPFPSDAYMADQAADRLEALTRSVEPTEAMIEAVARATFAAHHAMGPTEEAYCEPNWGRATDERPSGFKTERAVWDAVARSAILAMQSLSHKETMG